MGSHMLDQEWLHRKPRKPSLSLFSANAYSCIPHHTRWRRYGLCILPSYSAEAILQYDWFWITEEYAVLTQIRFCACRRTQLTNTEKVLLLNRCRLQRKHMLVGKEEQLCGKKKTAFRTSTHNKDHQGIVEVLLCLHISCLSAHLCNFKGLCSGGTFVTTQIPNEVHTPSFQFQTPHKGICLAQAQNPITTAVMNILWYLQGTRGSHFMEAEIDMFSISCSSPQNFFFHCASLIRKVCTPRVSAPMYTTSYILTFFFFFFLFFNIRLRWRRLQ